MVHVGIIGATGLSGLELTKILHAHPHVQLKILTSDQHAGRSIGQVIPSLQGLPYEVVPHETDYSACDVIFLAVPNEASLNLVPKLLKQNKQLIDLSGVFRLRNVKQFEKFYALEHTAPELLERAVFGLSEYARSDLKGASLVANPGCYPTGALLGLLPLAPYFSDLASPPIIDAKSGASGAGNRTESPSLSFINVYNNFSAYKVFQHQHQPEIQEALERFGSYQSRRLGQVLFTPHLLPVDRGILSTIYLRFKSPIQPEAVSKKFQRFAEQNPFVFLTEHGNLPSLKMVQHTNRCGIGFCADEQNQNLIVVTAIDNLLKGASGQAVQNLNLMHGFPETAGLFNPAQSSNQSTFT